MRARWLLLPLFFLVACGERGPRTRDAGPREPPAWLRRHYRDAEITPFTGYAVPGVDLFEVNWAVMDAGSAFVVGLGQRDGKLIAGPALFARIARERLSADVLARRAYGIVVQKDRPSDEVLTTPEACRRQMPGSARCAIVSAPKVEGGVLTFYAFQISHMELYPMEHRVVLATGEATSRRDLEVFRERGLPIDFSGPECRALIACGEWTGCARVTSVEGAVPLTVTHRRLDTDSTTSYLTSVNKCEGRICFVSFAEDGVYRMDALAPVGETCARVARPSEAPFHCVPVLTDHTVTGCTRVERHAPAR